MLKVALLLSGQPRSFEKGFEYHKKNLLDKYSVDVYMHTWKGSKGVDELLKLYTGNGKNIVKLSTVNTVCFPDTEQIINEVYSRIPNKQFPAYNTYRMFYSMYAAWKLMEQTRINYYNDTTEPKKLVYDVVVRSRYDYALNIVPPLHETRVNTVYVPADRMTKEHDFCADMFAWGTPNVMEVYSKTFKNLGYLYDHYNCTFIGEDLLAAQLKENGLTGPNMAYVNMNNPFPPGPYNGNYHSIIRDDFRDWNKDR